MRPRVPEAVHEDVGGALDLIVDLVFPSTLSRDDRGGEGGTQNDNGGRSKHCETSREWVGCVGASQSAARAPIPKVSRSSSSRWKGFPPGGDAGSDADPEGCGRQYGHQWQDRDRKKDGARNEAGDDGRHGVLHRVHEPQPAPYKPTRHDEAAYQCGNAQQEPNHGSSKEVCPPYGTCGALVSQANPCRGCSPSSI